MAGRSECRGFPRLVYVGRALGLADVRTLLADAHSTAIRKLLLPVLPHTLFAPPGPPLPHSHPSPALLAKLYLHIAGLYTSARALFKVHAEPSSRKLFKSDRDAPDQLESEIIPAYKRYLRKESLLASALAHKWLGVDAGENGKVGEAIAWCREAKSKLEELEDGAVREKMKGLGMGKANDRKKDERRARKGRVERELEAVGAWIKSYSRMNDTVSSYYSKAESRYLSKPSHLFLPSPYLPADRSSRPNCSNRHRASLANQQITIPSRTPAKGHISNASHTPADKALITTDGCGSSHFGSIPSLLLLISPLSAETIRLASSTPSSSGLTLMLSAAAPPYSKSSGEWHRAESRSAMRRFISWSHWTRAASRSGARNAGALSEVLYCGLTREIGLAFADEHYGWHVSCTCAECLLIDSVADR